MISLVEAFQALCDERGVAFCHWKSNESLGLALNAGTDLDLMFMPESKQSVYSIMADLGIKRCMAVPERRYTDIDDFIGIDEPSGRVVHFHSHFQLDVGEKLVKSYRLPFASDLVSARVLDERYEFWTASPEWEMLLLVLRQVLRRSPIERGKAPSIGRATSAELAWLRGRVDSERFSVVCRKVVGPNLIPTVERLVNASLAPDVVREAEPQVRAEMAHFRNAGATAVALQVRKRWWTYRVKSLLRRAGVLLPLKRTFPREGVIAAVIGADGAGKSTLVSGLVAEFGRKLDVERIYFGHGRSGRSPLVRFSRVVGAVIGRFLRLSGLKSDLGNHITTIGIVLEKARSARRAERARSLGFLVICDRFPQSDVPGVGDGLRWADVTADSNGLLKRLAAWERAVYERADALKPEIVIKLVIDPTIARVRAGGEVDVNRISQKDEIVRNRCFGPETSTITIDAGSAVADLVKAQSATAIWRAWEWKWDS